MNRPEAIADFNNIKDLQILVTDTDKVSRPLMLQLRGVHQEYLRSQLPKEEWSRIDPITNEGNSLRYIDSRIDPTLLVGEEWNDSQLFNRPLIAIAFLGEEAVGAVLNTNNSSSSLPEPLNFFDYYGKMLLSPEVEDIPHFSGKRYVHFREAYFHPDLQSEMYVDDGIIAVNGIIIAGLYYSLQMYNGKQVMTAYTYPKDNADSKFTQLNQLIGMEGGDTESSDDISESDTSQSKDEDENNEKSDKTGFKGKPVRVHQRVAQTLVNIENIPGAMDGLDTVGVTKDITKRSIIAEQKRKLIFREKVKLRNRTRHLKGF